jgi:hypothetical protein
MFVASYHIMEFLGEFFGGKYLDTGEINMILIRGFDCLVEISGEN